MSRDVFVSYSHKDKVVADAVINHLENQGIRCWYAPRDIETGQEWASSIVDAISHAKILVLIFTDYSNNSVQVRREIDGAISHGLTIIPLKLTESAPTGAMEYYLSTLHWLDAMNDPLEQAIQNLCTRVVSIINSDSGASETNPTTPLKEETQARTPQEKESGEISKTKRIVSGFLAFPNLFTGVILIICGIVDMPSNLIDSMVTLLFGISFFFFGLLFFRIFEKRKRLAKKELWIYIALSLATFFAAFIVAG